MKDSVSAGLRLHDKALNRQQQMHQPLGVAGEPAKAVPLGIGELILKI